PAAFGRYVPQSHRPSSMLDEEERLQLRYRRSTTPPLPPIARMSSPLFKTLKIISRLCEFFRTKARNRTLPFNLHSVRSIWPTIVIAVELPATLKSSLPRMRYWQINDPRSKFESGEWPPVCCW